MAALGGVHRLTLEEETLSAIVAASGPFDPAEGARMLDRLTHRGPDGEGHQRLEGAWLGHRRLAIVDLEGGAQPLNDPERGLWLVGDGTVYNHERLRRDLEERGHTFRTRSDHETVLHLLAAEGPAALTKLWGMWAVVAADEHGTFVAARDRIGIAPLYWARDGDTVVFASEIKGLRSRPARPRRALPARAHLDAGGRARARPRAAHELERRRTRPARRRARGRRRAA